MKSSVEEKVLVDLKAKGRETYGDCDVAQDQNGDGSDKMGDEKRQVCEHATWPVRSLFPRRRLELNLVRLLGYVSIATG